MRTLIVLALLIAAPFAVAQDHDHAATDGAAMVLHDGPDSGRAVVGAPTHFGFQLVTKDGAPADHRDAAFEVWQEGVLLFATTDSHEYDGHFSFDVVFPRPGPYEVRAMSEAMLTGVFAGEAVLPLNETEATIVFEPAPRAGPTNEVAGTLALVDPSGAILRHVDLLVELRKKADERLAARFQLHVHDEPAAFSQSAGAPGEYVLVVVGSKSFATGRAGDSDVRASTARFPVTLGPVAVPATPSGAPEPRVLEPRGATATSGDLTLHAMYDPQSQVGVGQTVRLLGYIANATGHPRGHVDFTLDVQGPRGVVFSSGSLHEYDGALEYAFTPEVPGVYEALLRADTGDAELEVPFSVQVVPPVVPLAGVGPGIVTIQGLNDAKAGAPTDLTFRIAGPQGPIQHSEVDVAIYHDDEPPAYRFKLHTHGSGETRATLVFPHEGEWRIRVDPVPTLPHPVLFQGARPGAPIVFAATVAPGDGMVPELSPLGADQGERPVPAAPVLMVLGALAALALSRRR